MPNFLKMFAKKVFLVTLACGHTMTSTNFIKPGRHLHCSDCMASKLVISCN